MNASPHMSRLSPEMAALLDRVARETGQQPDPTTLPPAQGRALTAQSNRRWTSISPRWLLWAKPGSTRMKSLVLRACG